MPRCIFSDYVFLYSVSNLFLPLNGFLRKNRLVVSGKIYPGQCNVVRRFFISFFLSSVIPVKTGIQTFFELRLIKIPGFPPARE